MVMRYNMVAVFRRGRQKPTASAGRTGSADKRMECRAPNSFPMGESVMRFLENKKLATRIGIITTAITLIGMLLL